MILVHRNGASFFQFENLMQYEVIDHGVFTRRFGNSKGNFQSLNVSFGQGDVPEHVRENRRLIARAIAGEALVFAEQVHGEEIIVVNSQNSAPDMDADRAVGQADALVTNVPGKFLAIQLADCQSILLYDPIRQVIANVHCGWRGSIRNIIGKTVDAMHKCFQCSRTDIIGGIGPSLGPCCAEFINYRKEIPGKFWQYKSEGDYFDFWALSRDQLVEAGVLPQNIETGGICTKCNTSTFFSYRAEKQTGRFASVIGIHSPDALST